MAENDIRWIQRFSNYRKAFGKLEEVVSNKELSELSELEKEGLIQRFEYTYELAWKTLQDLLKQKGHEGITGPTTVLRQALQDAYLTDADGWRELKRSREMTSHTYNSDTAVDIAEKIYSSYFDLFKALEERLATEAEDENANLDP